MNIQILPPDLNEREFKPDNVSELSLFKVDTGIQGLPLKDYSLLTVFEKGVTLPTGSEYWTPTNFTDEANEIFLEYMKNKEALK